MVAAMFAGDTIKDTISEAARLKRRTMDVWRGTHRRGEKTMWAERDGYYG